MKSRPDCLFVQKKWAGGRKFPDLGKARIANISAPLQFTLFGIKERNKRTFESKSSKPEDLVFQIREVL
jgi:hypothetical protein